MAETFNYQRESEDDLIIIDAIINNEELEVVFDTGASHTFIHFWVLIKAGVRRGDAISEIEVSTANGIITAHTFKVDSISVLGIIKKNFIVSSYLFDDPEENHQGVIGLDFLKDTKYCIDMKNNLLTIEKPS
jgi:predicted aspartyl protease